ncbi:hypothetical protein PVAG01_00850 [Phlyctema vagabunda]|uniref:HEPN domain-containing protein n=1 Tax=Phlyctema vagabunda TaxID=108571 RepID=A0ABR4PWS7_9HELO
MHANMYEVYALARVAQQKLLSEVSKKSHSLRRLCGHANLYDSLLVDLKTSKQKQARELELFLALHEEKIEEVDGLSPDDFDLEECLEEIDADDWEHVEAISVHRYEQSALAIDLTSGYESEDSDLDFEVDQEGYWAGWEKDYALPHADFMSAVILAMDHNMTALEVAPSEVMAPRSLELCDTYR